jgi:Tfp pilus assembly protein PilF
MMDNKAAEAYKLMRAGQLESALVLAQDAVAAATVCSKEHGLLAAILCALGRRREAEKVVVSALQLKAGNSDALDALAHVSITLGQPQRANALYRRAVEFAPLNARLWYNLASSDRSLGKMIEAAAACERSITLDRQSFQSYMLRSDLHVQTAGANHVAELQSLILEHANSPRALIALGYVLGKEFDDLGRYDEAFRWFSQSAQTRRGLLRYDIKIDEHKIRRIMESYSLNHVTSPGALSGSARYVFIVGLPRSGTTLLERILTGMPGVRSNGETENFTRALLAATPAGPDDIFTRATRANPIDVASRDAALAGSEEEDMLVVEKLPLNYLYLGAIQRSLPDAKFFWMRRSPMDTCFAMYRTLFAQGYPFSYAFEELARYYAAFASLMSHWKSMLGSKLYVVNYEELVAKPHQIGAAVASHCGLQWDARALNIEGNANASFTASASQVRRPIHASSVRKWERYRKHLTPLAHELEKRGFDTGDS